MLGHTVDRWGVIIDHATLPGTMESSRPRQAAIDS